MAKFYTELDNSLRRFIAEQKIFFTASAPNDGRVNLSPKGMDSFRCLDRKTVAYLDLTGSGNETAAHLLEHNRITLMFCAFEGKPNIVRLYGKAYVYHQKDVQWDELIHLFPQLPGSRQIIDVQVELVQSSCGMAVPFMAYQGEREELRYWAEKQGEERLKEYRERKNTVSLDGKPTGIQS